jgi:hypothetical protein
MFNYVVEGKALIRAIPGLSTRTAQQLARSLWRTKADGSVGRMTTDEKIRWILSAPDEEIGYIRNLGPKAIAEVVAAREAVKPELACNWVGEGVPA